MTMVEKVARAICRSGICGPKEHLNAQEHARWRSFELEARAALEALREPTENMEQAARELYCFEDGFPSYGAHAIQKQVWQAMLDAALSEVDNLAHPL